MKNILSFIWISARCGSEQKGLEQAISTRLDEITAYNVSFKETNIDSKFNKLMKGLHEQTGNDSD